MVETGMLEKLIDKAIGPYIDELRGELWAHHWLLSELVRQLPRESVRHVAQVMDQARLEMSPAEKASVATAWERWQPYLMQRADVLEGDTPPQFRPHQPRSALRRPATDR